MKSKVLYRILMIVCLIIVIAAYLMHFISSVFILLMMIIISLSAFFNYKKRPNGKIYIIAIIITLMIEILSLFFKWDALVDDMCLLVNSILNISFHDHYAFKKNKH